MHLALVIASLSAGGAERVLCDLANHWVSQGHQVSLLTFESGCRPPFYDLDSKVNIMRVNRQNARLKLSVSCFINIIQTFFYFSKTLRCLKPTVIISFMDLANILTLLAIFPLKIPVIISERIDPQYRPLPRFIKWLRLLIYPSTYQLIVQTESVAAYFPKRFRKFISIIPNAVKSSSLKVKISEEVRSIISVGRLDMQKDQKTLIQAFANLLKVFPRLELIIYGEGKERKNLEVLIDSLNLKDSAKLPGVVSDVASVLRQADLFIFPSRYEGFPNALCEAMALGLPVIASNCSGNRDVVRDGIDGRLFAVGDVAQLTSIALELMGDEVQRARLSAVACTINERFESNRIYDLWDQQITKAEKSCVLP